MLVSLERGRAISLWSIGDRPQGRTQKRATGALEVAMEESAKKESGLKKSTES